jgi:hypothetical protein
MILLLTFRGKGLVGVEAVPLDVNNYRVKYRPRVLVGKAGRDVLESVNTASERFKTGLAISNDRGTLLLAPPETSGAQTVEGLCSRLAATAPSTGNTPQTSSSTAAP